jgi:integration host factor subunit alpha
VNKVDLVDAVYHRHGGISRQEAAELVDTILIYVKSALKTERRMHLSGFGSFQVVERSERVGRNPHTGRPIPLPARQTLVFRPSRALLDALNPPPLDTAVGQ